MTTFVPLTQDTEGGVSSAALGEWLLAVIKTRSPDKSEPFASQLASQYQNIEGEQVIKDACQLFELLLSEHALVFDFLQDAKDNGTTRLLVSDDSARIETEIKYVDALKQVEEYFTVLMYMLQLRFTSSGQIEKAGQLLLKALSDGDTFLELRLRLLQMLYNSVDASLALRVDVYIEILEFAARHGIFAALLPVIKKVEVWMQDWDPENNRKIYIFHVIAQELDKLGKHDLAYEYWEKRVKACDVHSSYSKDENVKATAEFVVKSIKADHVLYFDRLRSMPAISYLSETSFAPLVELLDIFIKGSEADLEAFIAKYGTGLLEELNLPIEVCKNKIKLLSLATLCQCESQVDISRIQQELGIDKENVEQVIVEAISKGVMDALIDQKSEKVIIRSVMHREFSNDQLKLLHANLLQWKGCVDNLISVVTNNGSVPGFL